LRLRRSVVDLGRMSGVVPRMAYRHMFIEDGSRHSMIHVQNPFSFFDPWHDHVARAVIDLHDHTGRRLGTARFEIPAFGTLAVDLRDLMIDRRGSHIGTVGVDLLPPRSFRRHLRRIAPGVPHIASPFWVRFFDDIGSQAFVHSIKADRDRLRGLPRPIGRLTLRATPGGRWESNRTIRLAPGSTAVAFLVNHARSTFETTCSWAKVDGGDVVTTPLRVEARGVASISSPPGFSSEVFVSVSHLSTPNAKPYVLVESSDGKFGLTHG